MADVYTCTLDEASVKKAQEELNEDPEERLSQIETFRNWVLEQPHLKCPTDAKFLLRFLRQGKFSQLRARETLQGWLKSKTELPKWFDNVDFSHPEAVKFLKGGYFLMLPKKDHEGRQIIMTREGAYTPDNKLYNRDEAIKALFGVANWLSSNESVMVNGIMLLHDYSSYSMKHQLFWGVDNLKKMITAWQKHIPGRFKGINFYNTNPILDALLTIIVPLFSKKFKDRIKMHGNNLESVYKVIPMECLPQEYLPDDYTGPSAGTVEDVIKNMLNDLRRPEVRDRMLYESDPKWGYDKIMKPDGPSSSFRRLSTS